MSNINWGQEIKDWIISILIAVVLALFIRYFIVELYLVEGPSMRPTLVHSERLVVNKFIYYFRAPERGEIFVFRYPRDPSRDFIKRVIGVEGDIIEVRQGQVFRNGELLQEPYILEMIRAISPRLKCLPVICLLWGLIVTTRKIVVQSGWFCSGRAGQGKGRSCFLASIAVQDVALTWSKSYE